MHIRGSPSDRLIDRCIIQWDVSGASTSKTKRGTAEVGQTVKRAGAVLPHEEFSSLQFREPCALVRYGACG